MRRAFSDTLVKIADERDDFVFLTGDLGFRVFAELERRHPARYINVGIAETQMVSMATGLALEGFRPVVYSIGSFLTGRAYEPIRVAINYHRAPVLIVGAGAGYIYARSGVTHQCAEDAALMSTMPGMCVVLPGSPDEVTSLLSQFYEQDSPAYMRIGRFGEREYDAEGPVVWGRARTVRAGTTVAVASTGDCVIAAVDAWNAAAGQGIDFSIVQFHTLTPFDEVAAEEMLRTHEHVIVVEEHFPQGALATRFERIRAYADGVRARLHRLGPEQELLLGAPTQDSAKRRYGIDAGGIYEKVTSLISGEDHV